ncbi:cation:proton antiporter [Aquicoccus sp. G2-2]|uniref:cation:proton antiporter domain-containing protein n=1 Tax=Aquicoccus sp. G2-2 TaxID=3092120 RepID=UPI002ADF13AC|nr:cation:proton antiporter [Aquicoccus sp. G2-2]MEA1113527.1 cation:proton antiporter [Aquicoccus sp. G2-2]
MTDFLLLAFVFLVAGVVAVPIASRLGLGSVLGYLIAGIVISPLLALLKVDIVSLQHFAEFGVVMMLFLVGLELEPKRLWAMRMRLLGLGGGQVGLTALAVMATAMAFGQPWTISLAIGLVFALSSTAIVLQTLTEKGLLKSDGGQSSFAVLLTQDIAVIPMLAFIPLLALPALGHGTTAEHATSGLSLVDNLNGWQTALVTLGAVAAVIVGGSSLTAPIFRFIAAAHLRELFTAAALLIVIGIALLMSLVGLSPALGTFLAGVVLANSAYRHELESDIDPFKGLLLGLFFMTVGASINFALLAENLWLIIGLTLGLMALKVLVLLILGYIFKLRGTDKWLFALGLAQAGEFGFVLLSFTVANGVIPADLADRLLLVVALSMLLTPGLFILYDRVIAPRYSGAPEREADTMPENARIIIAGAGRVGGLVDRIMRSADIATTVIDFNSHHLDVLQTFGVKHYYGDATRPDLLHAAGIGEAAILVIAIDEREKITQLAQYVHTNYPSVHVIARARDRDHVYDLWAAGCRDIIRETYDCTLRMGRSTFEALGIERPIAERMITAFNETDRRAMLAVADVYKPGIPPHENAEYVTRVREMLEPWQTELRERMEKIRADADQ